MTLFFSPFISYLYYVLNYNIPLPSFHSVLHQLEKSPHFSSQYSSSQFWQEFLHDPEEPFAKVYLKRDKSEISMHLWVLFSRICNGVNYYLLLSVPWTFITKTVSKGATCNLFQRSVFLF